ncbi:MAG TPA: transcriptional regulator [Tissierellales bacterium]|nr:transcriptional regulator [Tissierellales bacterium]
MSDVRKPGGVKVSTIGQRIRSARKAKKLSLIEVRDLTGLSTGNLSDLENDKFAPSANTLMLLKKVLEINIDWMLTGSLPMEAPSADVLREKTPQYLGTDEKMLLDAYGRLSEEEKRNVIAYMNLILSKGSL